MHSQATKSRQTEVGVGAARLRATTIGPDTIDGGGEGGTQTEGAGGGRRGCMGLISGVMVGHVCAKDEGGQKTSRFTIAKHTPTEPKPRIVVCFPFPVAN